MKIIEKASGHKIIYVQTSDREKQVAFYVSANIDTDKLMDECIRAFNRYVSRGKQSRKANLEDYAIRFFKKYYEQIEVAYFDPIYEHEIIQQTIASTQNKKRKRKAKLKKNQEDFGIVITPDSE